MALRNILLTESLSSFIDSGELDLYHYSRKDQPTLTLLPSRFGENPYSRNEMRVSDFPRVFFYLDPNEKEKFFQSNSYKLYTASVFANTIYNLRKDPNGYIQQIKDENDGALDFTKLLRTIKANNYKGVYYKPKRNIVAYFEPIVVTQIES